MWERTGVPARLPLGVRNADALREDEAPREALRRLAGASGESELATSESSETSGPEAARA